MEKACELVRQNRKPYFYNPTEFIDIFVTVNVASPEYKTKSMESEHEIYNLKELGM